MAEYDGMHDPPRQQREQARDDQCAGENRDHDAAVIHNTMMVRVPDAEREHHQREDR